MINQAKISNIRSIFNYSVTEDNYKIVTSAAKSALNQSIPAECQKDENYSNVYTWCFYKLQYMVHDAIDINDYKVQVYIGVGTDHFYNPSDFTQYFIFALGEISFIIDLIKV